MTATAKKTNEEARKNVSKKTASKKVKKTTKAKAPAKTKAKAPAKTKELVVVSQPKEEKKVSTQSTQSKPKKKISKGEIRHIRSAGRNGKIQNRLKGTAEKYNAWGHKVGSQAAKIDHMINAGRFSLNEIYTMSGAGTKGRLYNHFRSLKEKGHPVVNDGKKVKFA